VVAQTSEFRDVREIGLLIGTMLGAVQRASKNLLACNEFLEPVLRARVVLAPELQYNMPVWLAAALARLTFGLGSAGVLARSVRRTHSRGRSAEGRTQTTEGG
jgi:hypothetical protein